MALDGLLRVLRAEAEAEAATIRSAAEAEAAAIRARGESEMDARRRAFEAERDAAQRSAVELALVGARREARRQALEARERLLARVLSAAGAQFPGFLAEPGYRATLGAQLAEAVTCLAGRAGELRCHPSLQAELAGIVAAYPSVRLEVDPGVGAGFVLRSADGAVAVNATLEDRLTRLGARVRQEVAAAFEAEP